MSKIFIFLLFIHLGVSIENDNIVCEELIIPNDWPTYCYIYNFQQCYELNHAGGLSDRCIEFTQLSYDCLTYDKCEMKNQMKQLKPNKENSNMTITLDLSLETNGIPPYAIGLIVAGILFTLAIVLILVRAYIWKSNRTITRLIDESNNSITLNVLYNENYDDNIESGVGGGDGAGDSEVSHKYSSFGPERRREVELMAIVSEDCASAGAASSTVDTIVDIL